MTGAVISPRARVPFTLQLFQRKKPEHFTCFLFINIFDVLFLSKLCSKISPQLKIVTVFALFFNVFNISRNFRVFDILMQHVHRNTLQFGGRLFFASKGSGLFR